MLSTNSILKQGRYRIVGRLWADTFHSLYDARDSESDKSVIVFESPDLPRALTSVAAIDELRAQTEERLQALNAVPHPSVVKVIDHFDAVGRYYLVSEPVSGKSVLHLSSDNARPLPADVVARGAEDLLDAAAKLAAAKGSPDYFLITPSSVFVNRESGFRLLVFPDVGSPRGDQTEIHRLGMAFMPLELIWKSLDLASQNAIANTYDDGSLDILESDPDHRTDIYTLGAMFYFLLTGKLPLDALERSIEVLDGKPDPLLRPHDINHRISPELSEFVMKALRLRREDRFDDFEAAGRKLRTIESTAVQTSVPEPVAESAPTAARSPLADLADEFDLLEIPTIAPPMAVPANARTEHVAAAPPAPVPYIAPSYASAPPQADILNDDVLIDNTDEPSESRNEPTPAFREERSVQFVAETEPINFEIVDEPRRRNPLLSPVALVVAGIVVLGAAVWGVLSMNSGGTTAPRPSDVRSTVATAPVSTPATETPAVQPTTEPAAVEPTAANPGETRPEQHVPAGAPTPAKSRPQVADVKTKPEQKDTKAPADATPKPKKKVTVDDLISDN